MSVSLEVILTGIGLMLTWTAIQAGALKWVLNGFRKDVHQIEKNTKDTADLCRENRRRLIRVEENLPDVKSPTTQPEEQVL